MIVTCGTAMAFLDDAKYTGRPISDSRSAWRRVPRELLTLTWSAPAWHSGPCSAWFCAPS